MMARTAVVTGSASGIGQATKERLASRGERVIGVDLHDADVVLDLATPEGRSALPAEVARLASDGIDSIFAIAGLAEPNGRTVSTNFFGAVATLEGLRPLLGGSEHPRAVTVASVAAFMEPDERLVELMDANDEPAALARAEELAAGDDTVRRVIYPATKRAIGNWVRRNAASPEWAGSSIPLNAVAPAIVITPMTAQHRSSDAAIAAIRERVPMPLHGFAEATVIAKLLVWLASVENTHVCGQIVFVDGGFDAVTRGESAW